ncbi:hypothetical protein BX600DRAFT_434411 [Xylariales sp. PMI_506]|nr:hypothetical protein BX600DRAFT_434411 [Xylariales sp. PMI_506]
MKPSYLLCPCVATGVAANSFTSAVDSGLAYIADYSYCKWQSFIGGTISPLCYEEAPQPEGIPDLNDNPEPTTAHRVQKVTSSEDKKLAESLWPIVKSCTGGENGTTAYCVFSNPNFAGGRGITLLTTPAEALLMARTKAFTEPGLYKDVKELNAESSPKWRVEDVPGKGKGLIAAKNLEAGDHVMSVSAAIMVDNNAFTDLDHEQLLEMLANAIGSLNPKSSSIFLNLSTHDHAESHEVAIYKIILTNAFDISDGEILNKEEAEAEHFYTVFPEVSRMNHDCRPNSAYYFDYDTFTQNVFTVRPVSAGEEITITYLDPYMPKQGRTERLDLSWHFPCSCSLCTQHDYLSAASDARLAQIQELKRQLEDWGPTSQATPEMAEFLVSLYEQERLHTRMYEAYALAATEYNGAGEPWLAAKYARLAIQDGFIAARSKDDDSLGMKVLAEDPWSHWSWMLRNKRRLNWPAKSEE